LGEAFDRRSADHLSNGLQCCPPDWSAPPRGGNSMGPYGGWIQSSYDNGGGSNGVEPLLLDPSRYPSGGSVGIGTSSPSNKLDVRRGADQNFTVGAFPPNAASGAGSWEGWHASSELPPDPGAARPDAVWRPYLPLPSADACSGARGRSSLGAVAGLPGEPGIGWVALASGGVGPGCGRAEWRRRRETRGRDGERRAGLGEYRI